MPEKGVEMYVGHYQSGNLENPVAADEVINVWEYFKCDGVTATTRRETFLIDWR